MVVVKVVGREKKRRSLLACELIALSAMFAACSAQQAASPLPSPPPIVAAHPAVVGIASWYGPGFNGHRTSSGEIYDQEDLTAASVVFPLGTRLLVTDLSDDRSVEVTVNDHGPYVRGRELDLSARAARVLGMIGPGTARVRMEVLSSPAGGPALGQRYFVQLGSFADPGNARRLREQLVAYYPDVHVEQAQGTESRYYRVRMGAFMNRREAEERASRVSGFGYPAVIITE